MGDYQGRSTIVFVFFFLDYTTWLVFRFEGRIVVVPLLLGTGGHRRPKPNCLDVVVDGRADGWLGAETGQTWTSIRGWWKRRFVSFFFSFVSFAVLLGIKTSWVELLSAVSLPGCLCSSLFLLLLSEWLSTLYGGLVRRSEKPLGCTALLRSRFLVVFLIEEN